MFTVVIPLYNKENSISITLNSLLNQKYKEFEILIVNDGSTDKSIEVVEKFSDNRLRIINQLNAGVSSARNKGIAEAKYEWITFLDADDYWFDDHLSLMNAKIQNYPNHKVFCNSYYRSSINEEQRKADRKVNVINDYFVEGYKNFFFWTGVVCIHRSVFEKVGVFDTKITRGEDLDLWMRIGRNYSIVKDNIITAIYKQETENKLTRSKVPLDNCFENYLNFKDKSPSEVKYLKMLASHKIISLIKQKNIIDALKLMLKYNFKLIK